MTRLAFHRVRAADLPGQRTFYNCLKRLAAAGTLPAGVATPKGDGWAFDLPNPAREPEQVEAIIKLINEAARLKGEKAMGEIEKLQRKTEDQLLDWFGNNARYHEKPRPFYAVRVGAKMLRSDDTHTLFAQVKNYLAAQTKAA